MEPRKAAFYRRLLRKAILQQRRQQQRVPVYARHRLRDIPEVSEDSSEGETESPEEDVVVKGEGESSRSREKGKAVLAAEAGELLRSRDKAKGVVIREAGSQEAAKNGVVIREAGSQEAAKKGVIIKAEGSSRRPETAEKGAPHGPLVVEPPETGKEVVVREVVEPPRPQVTAGGNASEEVPRGLAVASTAKWWNCCGLFDAFTGSGR